MNWSAAKDAVLSLRRLRERLVEEVMDIRQQLQNGRDAVLAVRGEVVAARGTHPVLTDRLSAIETRLDTLENP